MSKTVAIIFLCNKLHEETYTFGQRIKQETGVNVYWVCDNPDTGDMKDEGIITIEDDVCVQSGYHNCMITEGLTMTLIKKNPISYDKMLYHFCRNKPHDFYAVFEDDVFIPSVEAVVNFINTYHEYDLVTPNNFLKDDDLMDWHWRSVIDKIKPPYYFSMVSAFGCSQKMFDVIENYVNEHKTCFFTEVMFNTLAMQNELNVTDALELKSVVWMGKWELDEYLLLPNSFFHPKKELDKFKEYRELIDSKKGTKYKPKNTLPDFIRQLM